MAALWINGNLSTASTVYALLQALENACIGPAPIRDKKNGQVKVAVFTHPILWICRRLSTTTVAKARMHAGFSILDSKSAWQTAHSHRLPMADGASDACERHGVAGIRWTTSGRRQAIDPGSQTGAMNASHETGVAGKPAWLCLPDGRATMGESLASCFFCRRTGVGMQPALPWCGLAAFPACPIGGALPVLVNLKKYIKLVVVVNAHRAVDKAGLLHRLKGLRVLQTAGKGLVLDRT